MTAFVEATAGIMFFTTPEEEVNECMNESNECINEMKASDYNNNNNNSKIFTFN